MLSMLWWLPVAVVAAAVVAVWWSARVLTGETAKLRVSMLDLAQVRPAMVELRAEIALVAEDATINRQPITPRRSAHDLGPR